MRFRSKKTERKYRERRTLVQQMLDEKPMCERCHAARSVDIHEVVSRARGGSILDPRNLVALCRQCHQYITEHPAIAEAEGWSRHSWERDRYLNDVEGMPE
jgi:5-methylcytosine-specific restriction endonuclease McrA